MSERRKVFELFEKNKGYMEERIKSGIEQNRKGYGEIFLKDSDGNPVKNAEIKVVQKKHEFKYGANLFMLDELETKEKNEKYKEYFKDLFNMATLPFYWSDLEPEKGKPRYAKDSPKIYRRPAPDLCIEFCEKYGIEPREHALAYDGFFPKWLKYSSVEEVKSELNRRFKEISERYADKIPTIEVTNEMNWGEGKTAFYECDDYLEWCFKLAEKWFPANKLCINEWCEFMNENGRSSDSYYSYIEKTMLKGARIDAIGMQYHMFNRRENEFEKTRKYYDPVHMYRILDQYSHLGKPIEMTEVTIPAYSNDAEDEAIQAELIEIMYSIWFSHPNVEQIIYWNMVDGYAAFAPQGDMQSGENYYYGGLVRFDMTPKPAYYAIKNLFEKKWHTEESLKSDADGFAKFNGFYGEYEFEISYNNKKTTKQINLGKKNIKRFELTV